MKALKTIGSFLYKGWMAFARALAFVNTALILTLVYILLIGPSWIIMKLAGKDLLDRRIGPEESSWKTKEPLSHTLDQARHQF